MAGLTVSIELDETLLTDLLAGMQASNAFLTIRARDAFAGRLALTDQPFDTGMTTCALVEATRNRSHQFASKTVDEINLTIPLRGSGRSALLVVLPDILDLPDVHHQRQTENTESVYPSQSGVFNAAKLGVDLPVVSALRVITRHFIANSRVSTNIFQRNSADPFVTWGLASLYLHVAEALADRVSPSAEFTDTSTKVVRVSLLNAMVVLGSGANPVTFFAWRILGDARHRPADIQRSTLADWAVLYRVMRIFDKTKWPMNGAIKMTRWFILAFLNRVYVEPLAKQLVKDIQQQRIDAVEVQKQHLKDLKSGPFSVILRSMVDLIISCNGRIDLPEVNGAWKELLLQMDSLPEDMQSNRSARRRSVYAIRLPLGACNPFRNNREVTPEEKVSTATEILTRWVKRGWWMDASSKSDSTGLNAVLSTNEKEEEMSACEKLMIRATKDHLAISKAFTIAPKGIAESGNLVATAASLTAFVRELTIGFGPLEAEEKEVAVEYMSFLLQFAGIETLEQVAVVVQLLLEGVREDGVAREEKAMKKFKKYLKRSTATIDDENLMMEV